MDYSNRPYEWVGATSEKRAALTPDRIALEDATTGTEYTYADLDARANRPARLLSRYGAESGERVVTLSRNRPELIDLYFGTAKTGGVLAPLSHRLAPRELAELTANVEPSLFVVEEPFVDLLADAREQIDLDCPVLVLETDGETDGTTFADALPADDSPVEIADVSLDDPHLFLHTGGSTGIPKETILTHGSIRWNAFNTITSWGLRDDDVTPMVFPMFHTGGWNVLTIPFFQMGGTVIIAREFDPGQVLSLIDEKGATVLVAVPAMFRMLTEHERFGTTDLSTLRFAKSGGGPCRERVMEAWWSRGVDLSQGYGLTECGPNNFAMPDDWPEEKAESVGKPVLYADARAVDDDGEPVPQGEVGELELASPHAAAGYWRNEEETEATFGSGWVSTGDLVRVDDEGYYHIVGRKKNMFVSGGENVYPPAVENAIADHPKVEEVVVIGVPDDTWGTVGKAVVEGDESLTLDELREFLSDRMARFAIPRYLAFVGEMPTSGPSKIDRQAITDEFGAGEEG